MLADSTNLVKITGAVKEPVSVSFLFMSNRRIQKGRFYSFMYLIKLSQRHNFQYLWESNLDFKVFSLRARVSFQLP